jgi:hypothetical protein
MMVIPQQRAISSTISCKTAGHWNKTKTRLVPGPNTRCRPDVRKDQWRMWRRGSLLPRRHLVFGSSLGDFRVYITVNLKIRRISKFLGSTRLEYVLNRHTWCLIAQPIIPCHNRRFDSFYNHVDFLSAARFGIRVMPVLYFDYWSIILSATCNLALAEPIL